MGGEGLRAGIRDSGFGIRVRASRPRCECASHGIYGLHLRRTRLAASPQMQEERSGEESRPELPRTDDRACFYAGLPALPNPESRIPNSGARASARHKGFTLLEVLIALVILSLVLVALIRTAGLQAGALAHQRDSTLAQWVAANVAAELRATGAPPVGRQRGEERMGEQRWRWQADTSNTDVPGLRRMEIEVFEIGADDGIADPDGDPVARLTAFATP
jgi:general secretion pathway protein I